MDTKPIEVALIALALWWGIALSLPFDTFSLYSYSAMAEIAPEWAWALLFYVVSVLQFFGLTYNKYQMKLLSNLISTGLWIFIATMFFVSEFLVAGGVVTTAFGTYLIVSFINAWVCVRIRGECR